MKKSVLVKLGLAGIVLAVALALILVERLGTAYRDGLEVAAQSAALAAGAAEPMEALVSDLGTLADTLAAGLADARVVVGSAEVSIGELGHSASTDIAAIVDGVASLADRVAGVVETIERFIPGNRASTAEDLRQIADGLVPVVTSLESVGAQLEATAAQLASFDTTIDELEAGIDTLAAHLDDLAPSAAELASTADLLAERVAASQARLTTSLWLARLVVVLTGVVMAIILLVASRDEPATVSGGSASA